MAKSQELPGFERKRRILFGHRTSPEQMRETGRRFAAQERYDDALEFLSRTEARADVEEIARIAMERGDTALLLRAKAVLKEAATEAELNAVAARAEELGRLSDAHVAHLKAGHEAEAERVRQEIAAGRAAD